MTRLIIPALVALLVSGPVWAGSSEIKDCELLIKSELKFPGSYQLSAVWEAKLKAPNGAFREGKRGA